jgi:DNA modification methylase
MKRLNGGKQMKSVWEIPAPANEEKVFGKHPTQKPLALLERIIAASSDENDLVLDPFSGSATTGIAAARLNRKFVGIELEDEYLRVSIKRYGAEFAGRNFSPLLATEREMRGAKRSAKPVQGGLFRQEKVETH